MTMTHWEGVALTLLAAIPCPVDRLHIDRNSSHPIDRCIGLLWLLAHQSIWPAARSLSPCLVHPSVERKDGREEAGAAREQRRE